jgi:hypothetical protein
MIRSPIVVVRMSALTFPINSDPAFLLSTRLQPRCPPPVARRRLPESPLLAVRESPILIGIIIFDFIREAKGVKRGVGRERWARSSSRVLGVSVPVFQANSMSRAGRR